MFRKKEIKSMKKILMFLGVAAFLAVPVNGAFAWDISYLNPLPYFGIGCNQTKFSLNPFTGFKNCEPCKRVQKCKCDKCAMAEPVAPVRCSSCQRAYIEVIPTCPYDNTLRH